MLRQAFVFSSTTPGNIMLRLPIHQATTRFGMPAKSSDEVNEAFYARRASAYATGERKALRREISADAYLFLYKELVCLAGERTFCWPGLDFLTMKLDTSEGTIKRWMKELENANLIRRKSRPGGRTSITYITAFLTPDADEALTETIEGAEDDMLGQFCSQTNITTNASHESPEQNTVPRTSEVLEAQYPLFFGSHKEITFDQRGRSNVISHTVKDLNINDPGRVGGAKQYSPTHVAADNDVRSLLAAEEVQDIDAMVELQTKPLVELQAVSHYLDTQQNVRCRPGLFVWLARQGFGTQLLAGRKRSRQQREKHTAVEACSSIHEHVSSELTILWQNVLAQVKDELPESDFITWLRPTKLLDLNDHVVYIGTPNIFVRQEIEGRFLGKIVESLHVLLGYPAEVQVVIGS
jgi:DNA-binding MarR family transcriptional regulator